MARGNSRAERGLSRRRLLGRARRRAGGIKRKLLVGLVLMTIVVALLPTILARTPLLNFLLARAVPSEALRLSVDGASLSWTRGQTMTGLAVTDSAGERLIVVESITLDRSALGLAMDWSNLGVIRLERPTLYLKVRGDGSNLEDVLQKLVTDLARTVHSESAAPGGTAKPVAFAAEISGGTILAEDIATGRMWKIDNVEAQYDCRSSKSGIGNGMLSGQISSAGPGGAAVPAGRFAIALKPQGERHELTLQAEAIALDVAQPWLRRYAVTELNGTFSGSGMASWSTGGGLDDLNSTGLLSIDRLDATGPALAGDRVRLARVELPWRIVAQPGGLAVEELRLKSDVGEVAVRGRIDPVVLESLTSTAGAGQAAGSQHRNQATLGETGRSDVELQGAVDVARVAAMLPRALGIRGDTTITSGTIEIAGRVQPTAAGQSLAGSLRTARLAATSGGKPFQWDQPMSASFAVRRERGGLALDALACESKFFRVQASGTYQKLDANASFDLDSLAEQLGQFVDLRRTRMSGNGTAELHWRQPAADRFDAEAKAELAQVLVVTAEGATWAEPRLRLEAKATGLVDPLTHELRRVDTAQLSIAGEDRATQQNDVLQAEVGAPVDLQRNDSEWPITVRATGSLARWLTRARPWFAPGDWRMDGQGEIAARARVTKGAIDVSETKVVVQNLSAASDGWKIEEPRVELAGDLRVELATGAIAAKNAQFVTSTVSLATKDVQFAPRVDGAGQLAGAGAFRVDLARLASWQKPTDGPTQYRPAGEVTGNIRFVQEGGRITGEWTANGQSLSVASWTRGTPAPQTIWQEPRVQVRATAHYDSAMDRLACDELQVQSNTLQAAAAGSIERLSTRADCTIHGSVNYDLALVTPLLRPYVGEGLRLDGREQARFQLAGTLSDGGARAQLTSMATDPYRPGERSGIANETHWSRRIRAQLELPWSGANVYGLPVGAGRLAATLGDGAIQVAPLSLPVAEGQLNLAPTVRFDPAPSQLTMPPGPVLTNVRISPEVSEAMLKFVAPVLAGATQSEGQFSLALDGLRMPLVDSKKIDSAGRLTVHAVRVTPGPTTQPFFQLAQQIEALVKRRDSASLAGRPPASLLSIRDQQVNFRVLDGRVHHQNMEFQVGEVVMRSQGSVGLDETIALTLSIPVQDAWIAKEPLLAGLKGQSLSVPVTGTLRRPQLDQRAVANLSGQLIQNAAGQAVGNEINKALDKFLKPRQ